MENSEISNWLVQCGVALPKAKELAERFHEEVWISDVNALRNCVECSPQFLEKLGVPFPVQQIINAKVFTPLQDLSVNDVKELLQIAFQEDLQYGLRFHAAKINGTVLGCAKEPNDLHTWGIDNHIHADAFFRRIEDWKKQGVAGSVLSRSKENVGVVGVGSSSSSSSKPTAVGVSVKENGIAHLDDMRSFEEASHLVEDTTSQPTEKDPRAHELKSKEPNGTAEVEFSHGSAVDTPLTQPEHSIGRDESFATPKKRKPIHSADPGPRVSPRQSVPPSIYTDSTKEADYVESPKLASRRRSVVKLTDKSSETPADEEGRSISIMETSQPNGTTGQKSEQKQTVPRKRRTAADFFEVGNPAIVQLVTQIHTGKVHYQIKSLNALHKIVAEDPSSVLSLREAGAVDTLLDLLTAPDELDTTVLICVLDVINTIIALARDSNVEYLIEQNVITSVMPLCHSTSARVRSLAVWIIGNAGTVYFKNVVIRPQVISALVESYETINAFKGRELNEVRDRFGETMKQLCSGSVSSQFHTLSKLLPVMIDIVRHEDRVDPVTSTTEALNHLIDSNGTNAVDVFIAQDVLPALCERLHASRAMIVFSCLRALAFIAACSNEAQIKALDPVAGHLQDLVLGTKGEPPSHKVFAQAGLLVSMLCKHGERAIQLILDQSPDVFQQFFDVLNLRTALQIKQNKVNNKAQNCALALMYAAQRGSNEQLAYLLGQGLYTMCFRVLATFDDIPNLVVQTLKALRRLVVKVENIGEVQSGEEDFQADRAWGQVRMLMHANKSGFARLQEVDPNSDSGMENDSQSTTDAKVRKYATRLYEAAAAQGLVTTAK